MLTPPAPAAALACACMRCLAHDSRDPPSANCISASSLASEGGGRTFLLLNAYVACFRRVIAAALVASWCVFGTLADLVERVDFVGEMGVRGEEGAAAACDLGFELRGRRMDSERMRFITFCFAGAGSGCGMGGMGMLENAKADFGPGV